MTTYAIGDVQGCYEPLQRLLKHIHFDRTHDRLWFVGDLVNRGPDSLECPSLYQECCEIGAIVVLGNHDLFLLAVAEGLARVRPEDTLDEDAHGTRITPSLLGVVYVNNGFSIVMDPFVLVHAGLLPEWSMDEAEDLALRSREPACRVLPYRDILPSLVSLSKLSPMVFSSLARSGLATVIKVLTRPEPVHRMA